MYSIFKRIARNTQAHASATDTRGLNGLPNALLIEILRQVPIEDRVGIRTVSQKWYNVILDLGYYIDPDFIEGRDFPHYPARIDIKANPAVVACNKRYSHMFAPLHSGRIFERSLRQLRRRRSEFITSPPISMIYVMYDNNTQPPFDRTVHMALRTATLAAKRSEGLRIGDLLDIFEKVRAPARVQHSKQRLSRYMDIYKLGNFRWSELLGIRSSHGEGGATEEMLCFCFMII